MTYHESSYQNKSICFVVKLRKRNRFFKLDSMHMFRNVTCLCRQSGSISWRSHSYRCHPVLLWQASTTQVNHPQGFMGGGLCPWWKKRYPETGGWQLTISTINSKYNRKDQRSLSFIPLTEHCIWRRRKRECFCVQYVSVFVCGSTSHGFIVETSAYLTMCAL